MSLAPSNLEIHGVLPVNPFTELLAESAANELNGSFRLAHEAQKIIVYLRKGAVVFAVSNLRQHRLFEQLLQAGKIRKETLAQFPNFMNDLEFSQSLNEKSVLSKQETDGVFARQIESILKNVFEWKTGEWNFSALARIRESIAFAPDTRKILLEDARTRSADYVAARFRSFEEVFEVNPAIPQLNLLPQEGFIYSRFENQPLSIHDLQILSGLPGSEVLKSLYALWLGGFITRRRWNSAFTESQIYAIKSARLTLKKDELTIEEKTEIKPRLQAAPETTIETPKVETPPENVENPLSIEEYLQRVESSENYYEMLDLAFDAPLQSIKSTYFALAKNFHPDKYHQESDAALQQRIQHAFTELAKAYDTLKQTETRQVYDFKLRKFIETGTSAKKEPEYKNLNNEEKAKEDFEQGFSLLMNENFVEALPYLTRAVQLEPRSARYHAYFGKALSADEKQRFKADAEFQTAVRMEPNNATFRLLLAEFYVQYNLLKRAEGELQRLLAIAPNNKEAQILLDTLKQK